ncbi:MAG: glycosyltransferase [Bacteroidales bacterium]|jgi:glycosyltransferase involved in cell wall biosynthesis|nr:glycosyltransferase [Bacteroidales bacterium]MDY0197852.1 glycosyltransferase [Tenuifilaceae bacterium]
MKHPKYSVIVPVFNRPDEVDDLLKSLAAQKEQNFEVIIVEDGSTIPCNEIVNRYNSLLNITYYSKPNSGPGTTRNYGAQRANGDFFIFFDSDCIIPPEYFCEVESELKGNPVDAFGGPDRAHTSFTPIQKAIGYSMTSFFTTGGIRGGKERLDKFYPRSFNMGISKEVFEKTGGFSKMRFGEDIDFSLRILEAGFTTRLFSKAFVFHKRRTNFRQFYKQVFNSGIARINLYLLHPKSLKIVHLLPSVFAVGMTMVVIAALFLPLLILIPLLYCFLVFFHSLVANKSIGVAALSIAAAWIQLFGYGLGFIKAIWLRLILNKGEFKAFDKTFYK